MTTTNQSLHFSLSRVARQAATAGLFIVLIAGYSASHPASYTTTTPPPTAAAASVTFLSSR